MVSDEFCWCQVAILVFRNYKVRSFQAEDSSADLIPLPFLPNPTLQLWDKCIWYLQRCILLLLRAGGRRDRRTDCWSHTVSADNDVLRRKVCLWLLWKEDGTHKHWFKVLYRALKMASTVTQRTFFLPSLSVLEMLLFSYRKCCHLCQEFIKTLLTSSCEGNFMITLTSPG